MSTSCESALQIHLDLKNKFQRVLSLVNVLCTLTGVTSCVTGHMENDIIVLRERPYVLTKWERDVYNTINLAASILYDYYSKESQELLGMAATTYTQNT
jgi:hypothetical protein